MVSVLAWHGWKSYMKEENKKTPIKSERVNLVQSKTFVISFEICPSFLLFAWGELGGGSNIEVCACTEVRGLGKCLDCLFPPPPFFHHS